MAIFSFRPALTLRGRKFKGLRGWAGKPFHPPLTDIPVGAYTLAPAFDLISLIWNDAGFARELYAAGTYTLIGGYVAGLAAMLTGFWDYIKSTPKGTQARRTTNAHGMTMLVTSFVVLAAIVMRLGPWQDELSAPIGAVILSVIAGFLTFVGGTLGGELVFDYGFNVETSGDAAVWHPSDGDVVPGEPGHPAAPSTPHPAEAAGT